MRWRKSSGKIPSQRSTTPRARRKAALTLPTDASRARPGRGPCRVPEEGKMLRARAAREGVLTGAPARSPGAVDDPVEVRRHRVSMFRGASGWPKRSILGSHMFLSVVLALQAEIQSSLLDPRSHVDRAPHRHVDRAPHGAVPWTYATSAIAQQPAAHSA